ncbi:MAG TPA: dihydrofolate reductase family protein [Candidatus Saccharimonadales bacterium]
MTRVLLIAALTADGLTAQAQHESTDWTSAEDKKFFVQLTRRAGVIVMGANTFRTINRALPGRRNIVYSHYNIDVPEVETTQAQPKELVTQLAKDGYEEIAVIGGSNVYDQFLQAGVVDELYLTVEPIIFGQGLPLFKTPTRQTFRLEGVEHLNADTVMLHYVRDAV